MKVAISDVTIAETLHRELLQPFAGGVSESRRMDALFFTAAKASPESGLAVLEAMEPYIPWELNFLEAREECYSLTENPLQEKAMEDFENYRKWEP